MIGNWVRVAMLGVSIAGCSGNTSNEASHTEVAMKTVQCNSGMPACQTQQVNVPASGEIKRTVIPTWVQREADSATVSYHAHSDDTDLYLFFSPTLPATFSSEDARSSFTSALLQFQVAPQDASGSATLLDSADTLKLGDFEQFEVVNGALAWRLAVTAGYSKHLVNVGNSDSQWCSTGDILGTCSCGCTGTPLHVTLEGTIEE